MKRPRTLIIDWQYNAHIKKVLRDRFFEGLLSEKVNKPLFMEPNAVNLIRCIELAHNVEHTTSKASK